MNECRFALVVITFFWRTTNFCEWRQQNDIYEVFLSVCGLIASSAFLFLRPPSINQRSSLLSSFFSYREKSRSQSSTFWHIWEIHGFHFLMKKFRISINRLGPPMKLIGLVNLIILFHLAPSIILYDKYFPSYDFLKIYLWKIQMKFFSNFYDLMLDQ